MEFDTTTDQLNTLISTEFSSESLWNAVPGGLQKVSTSSIGFVWGIGNGIVYACQLPCSGDWKKVDLPASALDITTDDSYVYVLYNSGNSTVLAKKSANNTDDWITIPAKVGMTKLTNTASYVWSQVGTQKWKLPKPGTTGNWLAVPDPANVTITSASSTSLYGVDGSGKALKSDESLQSGWSVIPEFGSKMSAIVGDIDQTAIFGVDDSNKLNRCENGKCSNVDVPFTPQNISIEPVSKQLWMTTVTSGTSGNIFNKKDDNDYSDILQAAKPIDQKRDEIVSGIQSDYEETTYANMLSNQFNILKKMIGATFDGPKQKDMESTQHDLNESVKTLDEQIRQLEYSMPFLYTVLIVLALTLAIYMFSGLFGSYTHWIALLCILGGTIYFAMIQ
jgi:hypothetical protein